MLKKRKATRDSLDELRKKMPVLSENQQRGCIAGSGSIDWWSVANDGFQEAMGQFSDTMHANVLRVVAVDGFDS